MMVWRNLLLADYGATQYQDGFDVASNPVMAHVASLPYL
jgi:hypothetical protein